MMKRNVESRGLRSDREGFALVLVLVVVLAITGVVAGAAVIGSSSFTMTLKEERRGLMVSAANAGLELGRARINGDKSLYPDSLFAILENGVPVRNADSSVVTGLQRWTYVGPTGITTGQYGVFGSIVSVVEDANGDEVIRRLEVLQESFAKYAYFTDIDFSANIWFGGGDQLFGPVHSNDSIGIYVSGATFHKRVSTAKYIVQKANGTFLDVVKEFAPRIPMPATADLNKLRNYAIAGGTRIVGDNTGAAGQATTRIEFMAIDLDGDGKTDGPDEGFMRVYQAAGAAGAAWISADVGAAATNNNCGDYHGAVFYRAAQHPMGGHSASQSLTQATRRCYLGGVDSLYNGFVASNASGAYVKWTGAVDPQLAGRPDKDYLWPLSRAINPNFKGVVFVDGKVVIHGLLRGRITLAATDNIIIGDDIRYVTDPSVGSCDDILGIFSATDVVIADNALNDPWDPNGGTNYRTYDETSDEVIHGVILALDNFTVENYNTGPSNAESCNGTPWGRGCLSLTGGVIQRQRGAVGLVSGRGYLKRYSYDACAATDPPPYFPTTGFFIANRYFDIDPTGFNIANLYASLAPPPI
jgi:Tfp pilus assembly protein PilX